MKKAASWLFKNAEPLKSISPASRRDSQGAVPVQFVSGVEIKAESICICFIDDCMDCDVPLAELTFSREFLACLIVFLITYVIETVVGNVF